MKTRYRITKVAKTLILQLIICMAGVICGFTWEIYAENTGWGKFFNPSINIVGLNLNEKIKEDRKGQLKAELINAFNDYKISIKATDLSFVLDCTKLIKGFDIDVTVEKAIEMDLEIKQAINENPDLGFTMDEEYLQGFILSMEKKINREPVDAAIDVGRDGSIRITPDIKGLKLKSEDLETLIKNTVTKKCFENTDLIAPIEEIPAKVLAETLSLIDSKIASASTKLNTLSSGRTNNIKLAADSIDKTLLMPGDMFSFNEIVGDSTKENGYMEAPVLKGVDYKSGMGGGICQVSSTLYNTVLNSGITPTERENHRLPLSYVDLGLDATVYYGSIDFKFINTLGYPLYIESFTEEETLNINFYSNCRLNEKEYVIKNEVYERIPYKSQIVIDDNLKDGETRLIRKGSTGYWVKVVRSIYEDDELVDSDIISDDYYEPVDEIIKKGN